MPRTSERSKRSRTPLIAGALAGGAALVGGLFLTAGAQSGQVLTATSSEKVPAAGQATGDTCYDPTSTEGGYSLNTANTGSSILVTGINLRLQDPTNSSVGACAGWTFEANVLDVNGVVLATSTGTLTSSQPELAFGAGSSFAGVDYADASDVTYIIEKGA